MWPNAIKRSGKQSNTRHSQKESATPPHRHPSAGFGWLNPIAASPAAVMYPPPQMHASEPGSVPQASRRTVPVPRPPFWSRVVHMLGPLGPQSAPGPLTKGTGPSVGHDCVLSTRRWCLPLAAVVPSLAGEFSRFQLEFFQAVWKVLTWALDAILIQPRPLPLKSCTFPSVQLPVSLLPSLLCP